MFYVEQRWYIVIGWGWISIFVTLFIMVTSGFNGLAPLYFLIFIDILILILIFRYWYPDGKLRTLKAIVLMVAFFTLFTSGLILYMGYILYGPHIKVMAPGSTLNFHYLPFIKAYQYYYPYYSKLIFFSIYPDLIPNFFAEANIPFTDTNTVIDKLFTALHKILNPNLAYYAGNKAFFPWPIDPNTLLGKHFIDNYINLLTLKNQYIPSLHVKTTFYNSILPRYNRLHFNLIPFKQFVENSQALKLLFLTVPPTQARYTNFTILIGLGTHLNIQDMVSVDPYTAEILMAASNYTVTGEISLYHWLGIAKVFKHSMLVHSHIYGMILYDYYTRLFFWKIFFMSWVVIVITHWVEPAFQKLRTLFNNFKITYFV